MIGCMARTTTVTVTDDLDNSPNAQEVKFGWDGAQYTIDLAKKNRTALERLLKPYIEVARRGAGTGSNGRSTRRGRRGSAAPTRDLSEIRAWAQANGHQVAERGRIAQSTVEEYEAAH